MFNSILGGRAALVAPVRVGGQTFGLLGLVWSEARQGFQDHEVALVEGIADQCGTALERDQLSAEVMHLRSALHERYGEDRIIGQTGAIRRAIELALNVADTQTTVLIQGESGTGKELLANLIHYNSGREDQPYVKLNCGAIPESCSSRNCLVMRRAPLPMRAPDGWEDSKRQTAERCFLTKSAR